MPQQNKKRGRRAEEKKRKLEDGDDDPETRQDSKRRKSIDMESDHQLDPIAHNHDESLEGAYPPKDKPFFGMLDDEEQEYFRSQLGKLETNSFADDERPDDVFADVYREADGKELKIAQSQSCSRLMERLIQQATPIQLKKLFQQFRGNFIHLITHRFASHCCEALFLRAAPVVTEELLASVPNDRKEAAKLNEDDETPGSMETVYLDTLAELEGNLGYLLTDAYASHALRILLLVLSGEPIDQASTKYLLQSKRKENNSLLGAHLSSIQSLDKERAVPDSFKEALEHVIADSIAGLDTEKLRALATHPNGNPSLQLLLKLELTHLGKKRAKDETSIIRTLLPDDPITADSSSAIFINSLVYDPVGSHLVERIVQHAPAKMFKSLYREFFKEKLASHARSEIAGYVVCRVLERLGHDDLLDAHEILVPGISNLLQRNRTVVIRTLIERCTVRDIDTQAIAVQIEATWPTPTGFEVQKLVKFGQDAPEETRSPQDSAQNNAEATNASFARSMEPIKVHFNLLAQAMLIVPGSLSSLVLDSLVALDALTLIQMSKDLIVSRTLQQALTTRNASMITVRKLIQHFYGHMGEMALDAGASHVVDCIWEGTHGLAFIRERIAEELAENESQLRDSACGRAVWKNWKMDLYKRKRRDWIRQSKIKASNDGFQSFSELEINKDKDITAKTPLQLARERHAMGKKHSKSKRKGKRRSSETNGGPATPTVGSRASAATAST